MSYATQQDMVTRFGLREVVTLTDRNATGAIDVTVLAGGLSAADNEINVYLAGRYDLPLATTPTIVRDFACDIARYRLCSAEVTETKEIRERTLSGGFPAATGFNPFTSLNFVFAQGIPCSGEVELYLMDMRPVGLIN